MYIKKHSVCCQTAFLLTGGGKGGGGGVGGNEVLRWRETVEWPKRKKQKTKPHQVLGV